jgi:NADPH2:quinone reductase
MLGRESEGTIVATGPGEVYDFQPGDRVVCLSEATYAEYTAAPAAKAAKLPASLPPKIAAGALLRASRR